MRPVERAHPGEESGELVLGKLLEQPGKPLAAALLDVAEHRRSLLGKVYEDNPPVFGPMPAFDQDASLHAVDNPRRARVRYVELLGQAAHGERALRLEDRQDVQMNETEGAAVPAPKLTHSVPRAPPGQLIEQLGDEPPATPIVRRGRVGALAALRASGLLGMVGVLGAPGTLVGEGQCHVDSIGQAKPSATPRRAQGTRIARQVPGRKPDFGWLGELVGACRVLELSPPGIGNPGGFRGPRGAPVVAAQGSMERAPSGSVPRLG